MSYGETKVCGTRGDAFGRNMQKLKTSGLPLSCSIRVKETTSILLRVQCGDGQVMELPS